MSNRNYYGAAVIWKKRGIMLTAGLLWACSGGDPDDPLPMPPIVMPNGGAPSNSSMAGAAGVVEQALGGSVGVLDPVAGAGGQIEGGEGGEGGVPMMLPKECPGEISDYTSVTFGDDAGEVFGDDRLDGQALVLGGSGDDLFLPSPPGAGDCLFGGAGNDRFETTYLSAPSVFIGGDGDDVFVLRGSTDTDTAYISDFKRIGQDQIHLDAMVYGLTFVYGAPLATELVVAPGFAGGNSNAGDMARILYVPETGTLWYDSDASGEVAQAVPIAVIQNFADYSFDLQDFTLE